MPTRPSEWIDLSDGWHAPTPPPRRPWGRAALVLAAVAATAVVAWLIGGAPRSGQDDVDRAAPRGALTVEEADGRGDGGPPNPTPEPSPSAEAAPVAVVEGEWETLPQAPFAPRWSTPVAAGDALVVWGGSSAQGAGTAFLDDGAVLRDGGWEELPASPLEGRSGAAMAAADDRLVVWGGLGRTAMLDDGAVYDLGDRRWRRLPPAPLSPRTDAGMAWDGEEILVVGGRDNAGTLDDGAAYDPDLDRWRALPAVPAHDPVDPWGSTEAHWTGEDLVGEWSTPTGGSSLFRLARDGSTWEEIDTPSRPLVGRVHLVADGDDLVAVTQRADGRPRSVALREGDRWVELDAPDVPRARGQSPQEGVEVVDGRLYLVAGADVLVLDLAERSWASLGGLPAGLRLGDLAFVDDPDRLVVWSQLGRWAAVWRPASDSDR